jgi:1-deoxy-D-xylulose-5-phosphate reductoisomerase
MDTRRIVILGSTGSIGRATLDVVLKHPGAFSIEALAANSDVETILEQYRKWRPRYVCLINSQAAGKLAERLKDEPVEVLSGEEDLLKLTSMDGVDMVVNAIVGAAGLRASLLTLEAGKDLALANKESLVVGGPLFEPLQKKSRGKLLPIDSEHSAVWQSLRAGREEEVRRIILTASGGPFRTLSAEHFANITVEQALNHPTWKMGSKITIDSATLANKGLEVIEAVTLFKVPAEQVSVVVHPQSIVHSMVEFVDSSIIAQLSQPDMRLPISYALFWPDRVESDYGRMELSDLTGLTFEPPDLERFPCLRLAFDVAQAGGTAPAAFNAANEVAVEAFLKEQIKFTTIADTIEDVVNKLEVVLAPTLDDILSVDKSARALASAFIGE